VHVVTRGPDLPVIHHHLVLLLAPGMCVCIPVTLQVRASQLHHTWLTDGPLGSCARVSQHKLQTAFSRLPLSAASHSLVYFFTPTLLTGYWSAGGRVTEITSLLRPKILCSKKEHEPLPTSSPPPPHTLAHTVTTYLRCSLWFCTYVIVSHSES
jgi:hypothetical protein